MKSKNYPELIKEREEELLALEKEQEDSLNRDRLRFLRYLKTGLVKTQGAAGHLIGLGERQSQNLWKLYAKGGLASLVPPSLRKGYFGRLTTHQYSALLQYLDENKAITQQDIIDFIAEKFGIDYCQSAISRMCERLKIKNKTGRPSNVRKDEAGAADFKKNSTP